MELQPQRRLHAVLVILNSRSAAESQFRSISHAFSSSGSKTCRSGVVSIRAMSRRTASLNSVSGDARTISRIGTTWYTPRSYYFDTAIQIKPLFAWHMHGVVCYSVRLCNMRPSSLLARIMLPDSVLLPDRYLSRLLGIPLHLSFVIQPSSFVRALDSSLPVAFDQSP